MKCGIRGRNVNASVCKRRQNSDQEGSHNRTRGEAKGPRERKRRDGRVVLLGRGHQGRPEVGGTLTRISHGVEISIAGGGADKNAVFSSRLEDLVYMCWLLSWPRF